MKIETNSKYFKIILLTIGCIIAWAQMGIAQQQRTEEEVNTLITEAGSNNPQWWDSVELVIPETLDVNWPVMTRGGRGQRGQRGVPGQQPFPPQRGGAPAEAGQRGERGVPGEAGQRGERGAPGEAGQRGGFGERGGRGFQQGPPTNVDQYVNNVLSADPSRHREGIKLVDHLLNVHKDDEQKLQRSLNMLAQLYYDLLDDYARAAYYWNESIEKGGTADMAKLADCYYELGNKEMAMEVISQQNSQEANQQQRLNTGIVRLLAKMGEIDSAIEMIEANTQEGNTRQQGGNYLLTAGIYRQAGRYDEAVEYYQKVLDLPEEDTSSRGERGGRGGREEAPGEDIRLRANTNMEAVKLLSELDMSQVPDGTYTASIMGRNADLTISVTVNDGEIESFEVTENEETPNFWARALKVTRSIVSQKDIEGIDAITGATVSSDAVINAAIKALSEAME